MFCTGVLEQAPELGVRTVAAHRLGHGHGEHPSLRRLQQTEYNARRESHVLAGIPAIKQIEFRELESLCGGESDANRKSLHCLRHQEEEWWRSFIILT